jgi:hypothetical protein
MVEGKRAAVLLERAGVEEKGYNWVEAARLYEQAAKSFLGKEMVEEAAGALKRLGYACYWAGRTAETAEEYKKLNRSSVKACKEAANLFKQSGNRPEELECKAEMLVASGSVAGSVAEAKKTFSKSYEQAEMLVASGSVAGSVAEAKKTFSKSYELFVESSELYSKGDDRESFARTLSRAAWASSFLAFYCSDRWEIEQVCQKGKDVADKAWKLSKEIGNIQSLVESLYAETFLTWAEMWIVPFRRDERRRQLPRVVMILESLERFTFWLVVGVASLDFSSLKMKESRKSISTKGWGYSKRRWSSPRKQRITH